MFVWLRELLIFSLPRYIQIHQTRIGTLFLPIICPFSMSKCQTPPRPPPPHKEKLPSNLIRFFVLFDAIRLFFARVVCQLHAGRNNIYNFISNSRFLDEIPRK